MIYQRTLKTQLVNELDNEKILILTGPRQSGKTTLLKEIADELEGQGEKVHFYNFDRVADLEFFSKQQKVEAFLKIRSLKSKLYIFIDEVQRKKDAGNFFKYFYDAKVNAKFIFSGSSSVELTDSFGDALTGRKRVFTLLPLSLQEVAGQEFGEEFEFAKMGEPQALGKIKQLVSTSLIWGNYPEVTVKQEQQEKMSTLEELYESYVQKDVKDLLRVKNIAGFNLLVKYLAHSVGEPIVVEDLVKQTGLHANTVNSYLDILEGTLVIARTDNYNPEFETGLPKAQRFYFVDNGMRNFVLNQMQSGFRADYRKLAANLVYSELRKILEYIQPKPAEIFHYQTYSDNHVDFVVASKTSAKFLPIVVRYGENTYKLGKKIHEYINTRKPDELIIITEEIEKEDAVKSCLVKFIPLEKLIAQAGELIAG